MTLFIICVVGFLCKDLLTASPPYPVMLQPTLSFGLRHNLSLFLYLDVSLQFMMYIQELNVSDMYPFNIVFYVSLDFLSDSIILRKAYFGYSALQVENHQHVSW